MDRLEAMSILIAVTERGSLSAAGRALGMPLPTVSRKISDLEALLGTRLLIRTTRKLMLTDAGIAYVAAARRILDQVDEAERQAAEEFVVPKGELAMTAPLMFGRLHVLPLVADFLASYDQITVRLTLSDRNVDLIDDHLNLAVRIGKLPDSSMVATPLGTIRMVTCASPGLLDKLGTPNVPEDLAGFPCVALESPMPASQWQYRVPGSLAAQQVMVKSRLTTSTPEAAAHAAVRSVGAAQLLQYQVADDVQRGRLKIILEAFEPEPVAVHLVHASRGQMPLKMRRFVDVAIPRLRAALKEIAGLPPD